MHDDVRMVLTNDSGTYAPPIHNVHLLAALLRDCIPDLSIMVLDQTELKYKEEKEKRMFNVDKSIDHIGERLERSGIREQVEDKMEKVLNLFKK